MNDKKLKLEGLSQIRSHFFRDPTPTWYACANPYYMLGMDEWVRGFRFLSAHDSFDEQHPRVFAPPSLSRQTSQFDTLEELNAELLRHPAVQTHIRARGPGRILMMLFDEEAEALCAELGLEVLFPHAELRRRMDSKVEATRLANRAGVPSVPHVLGHVGNWAELRQLAGHLGNELVIQTPFGDSGTTTFFVASEADLEACQKVVAAEHEVKVMKRIRPAQAAVEACVTRAGTIVGPVMTELVGHPELTPYRGGWAGNEVAPAAFTEAQRAAVSSRTEAFGTELQKEGWRGYFEIDWLVDKDNGEIYLGEVNPRLTGASPLTNLAAFAHADAPLALFHLLEYSDFDFDLDVPALNRRWAHPNNSDHWGQLILKYTDSEPMLITQAPSSGGYRMNKDGSISWRYMQTHRRTVEDDMSAFFVRFTKSGEVLVRGDDIGALVVRGRLMDADGQLTDRAKAWNRGIRAQFTGLPVNAPPAP